MFRQKNKKSTFLIGRFRWAVFFLLILFAVLIARLFFLTVIDHNFLLRQGDARSLRIIDLPAHRGMILDRNGEPLAVSAAVNSVWINPQDFPHRVSYVIRLANILHIQTNTLSRLLTRNSHRQFVYVKRDAPPEAANAVKKLSIPGVYMESDYKRYYPTGEVNAHLVGFTDVDEQGVSGLELAYNDWLKGKSGKEKVLKDLYGHVVALLSKTQNAESGKDLYLSIDNRIQFLAYNVLKETVQKHHALSGSVVVLNPETGEVLAIANQPSFNPNKHLGHDYGQFRNRAVTDVFEPGSTMKIFSIINALDSGKYTSQSLIDTNPGYLKIGSNIVYDNNHEKNGVLTVTGVLKKSSNIGVSKMTLSLPPSSLLNTLDNMGFGMKTGSSFPGESAGSINNLALQRPFVLATISFGYGISATALQMAAAYGVIADGGSKCSVTFLKRTKPIICPQVLKPKIAHEMLTMLESVLQSGGTGTLARISGYRIAGKTGTAHIAGDHGYERRDYESSFIGIGPVNHPQLVVAVFIRAPQDGGYYGGLVAAPAFQKIMSGALRILNIAPSALS